MSEIEDLKHRIERLEKIVDGLTTNNNIEVVRKSRPNNLHLFIDSPFYDFDLFRTALLKKGWAEEEINESYQSAKLYSESKNAKYSNWISAVENWKRKELKSKSNVRKSTFEDRNSQRIELGSIADEILANRQR